MFWHGVSVCHRHVWFYVTKYIDIIDSGEITGLGNDGDNGTDNIADTNTVIDNVFFMRTGNHVHLEGKKLPQNMYTSLKSYS